MLLTAEEGLWLASLPAQKKLRFLAEFGHELTIVGRNSYRPLADDLDKPAQLRALNEIQHRVLAGLVRLLDDPGEQHREAAIVAYALEPTDLELRDLTQWAWRQVKQRVDPVAVPGPSTDLRSR